MTGDKNPFKQMDFKQAFSQARLCCDILSSKLGRNYTLDFWNCFVATSVLGVPGEAEREGRVCPLPVLLLGSLGAFPLLQ